MWKANESLEVRVIWCSLSAVAGPYISYQSHWPASTRAASNALRRAKNTPTDIHRGGSPVAVSDKKEVIRKKIKTLGVLPLFTLGPVDSRGMGSVLEEADTEICWYVPIHRWLIIPSASGKFATSFGIVNDALTCP